MKIHMGASALGRQKQPGNMHGSEPQKLDKKDQAT